MNLTLLKPDSSGNHCLLGAAVSWPAQPQTASRRGRQAAQPPNEGAFSLAEDAEIAEATAHPNKNTTRRRQPLAKVAKVAKAPARPTKGRQFLAKHAKDAKAAHPANEGTYSLAEYAENAEGGLSILRLLRSQCRLKLHWWRTSSPTAKASTGNPLPLGLDGRIESPKADHLPALDFAPPTQRISLQRRAGATGTKPSPFNEILPILLPNAHLLEIAMIKLHLES